MIDSNKKLEDLSQQEVLDLVKFFNWDHHSFDSNRERAEICMLAANRIGIDPDRMKMEIARYARRDYNKDKLAAYDAVNTMVGGDDEAWKRSVHCGSQFLQLLDDDRKMRAHNEAERKAVDAIFRQKQNRERSQVTDQQPQNSDVWGRVEHNEKPTEVGDIHDYGKGLPKPDKITPPPDEMAWRCGSHEDSVMFVGLAGAGKSSLVVYIAWCIAMGKDLFGRPTKKGKVILFTEETEAKVGRKTRGYNEEGCDNLIIIPASVAGWRAIRKLTRKDDISMIIVDTVANCKSKILQAERSKVNPDENKPDLWGFFDNLTVDMKRTIGCQIRLIHHSSCITSKDKRTARELIRGSSAIEGSVDVVQVFYSVPGEGNIRHIETIKERDREMNHFTVEAEMVDGGKDQWGEDTKIIASYKIVDANLPIGELIDFGQGDGGSGKKRDIDTYLRKRLPEKFGNNPFDWSEFCQAVSSSYRTDKDWGKKLRNYLWKNSQESVGWLAFDNSTGIERWCVREAASCDEKVAPKTVRQESLYATYYQIVKSSNRKSLAETVRRFDGLTALDTPAELSNRHALVVSLGNMIIGAPANVGISMTQILTDLEKSYHSEEVTAAFRAIQQAELITNREGYFFPAG